MAVRLAIQAEPIPGYRLIERLGRGGFGEVWKAEAPGGLMKAIKFVYGELEGNRDRGVGADQELRALNRVKTVRHPFILSLERVDVVEGQLVIVMELADRNLLDRHRECTALGLPGVPREELLQYMEEAAEALDLMNGEYQLQHLDIKPQNLFLVRNHIKVADFGLVKDLEGMKASITGGVTPVYAAPETFEGWVTRFCDQYSLAIVYQELLTGQRPFDGTNAKHLMLQHVQEPPNLSSLPEADRKVIARALQKKPNDRFPSCTFMVHALRGIPVTEQGVITPTVVPPANRPTPMVTPGGRPPSVVTTPNSPGAMRARPTLMPTRSPLRPDGTARPGELAPISTARADGPDTPKPLARPRTQTDLDADLFPPIDFKGEGTLFPALIVGLGRTGLAVLQKLREVLVERYGTMDRVPHLRLLYIDTDSDTYATAIKAPGGAALGGRESFFARLNRPSHFLKPRDGQLNVADWLDPQQLFRMTRNQQTGGARCLGRLALVDSYRELADRFRGELAACTDAEALPTADRNTRLGIRDTKPRAYVIANLAGGTGGGMFIDVAYLIRSFIGQVGHPDAEIIGLFALPPNGDKPGRASQGSAVASLVELHHYSQPDVTFKAVYQAKQPAVTDKGAPYARCLFYTAGADENSDQEAAILASGLLFRDLTSPVGQASDEARAAIANANAALPPPLLGSAGQYRLSWPRRALVQLTARRLCLRTVQHWLAKDLGPLADEVQKWAKDQWERRMLTTERLTGCLRAAAEGATEEAPEEVFTVIAEKFLKQVPDGQNPDPALVQKVLEEVELIVGRPEGLTPMVKPPMLPETLEEAARALLATCEQKLSEMAVFLVEQPKFRFAGSEEAIRQFNSFLLQAVQQQEPLCQDFMTKSNEAYARILQITEGLKQAAGTPAARKPRVLVTRDLAELIRLYPTIRLRGMVISRLLTVLRSLLGNCPEFLREFTHCRNRISELTKTFDAPMSAGSVAEPGPGRDLFPAGCRTIKDAVSQVMERVTVEDLLELDQRIQAILKRQFTALVHVCTTPNNLLRELSFAMQQEAETYVAARLGVANAVETFLDQFRNTNDAMREVADAQREATPRVGANIPTAHPFSLVLVPSDNQADQFATVVRAAVPEAALVPGPKAEDIIFYREVVGLTMHDLPIFGADGRDAYQQMVANPNMMPHTRTDVTDWRLPE
jgi:hypothetical protein